MERREYINPAAAAKHTRHPMITPTTIPTDEDLEAGGGTVETGAAPMTPRSLMTGEFKVSLDEAISATVALSN